MTVDKQGRLQGYSKVWYDDRAMTNILSLNNMKKKIRVTYDSKNGELYTNRRKKCGLRIVVMGYIIMTLETDRLV